MIPNIFKPWLILCLMLLTPVAHAQDREVLSAQAEFSQQELDQMLAPIALYPDALLAQVLQASTYPLEVVQAARWSRAHPELKGDAAVRAAEVNNWDPSVISLTAFPQILRQMDEDIEWTSRLGEAFLAQQAQVMDSVQHLREKASIAGNLQSNEHITVAPQGEIIVIQQAVPHVVYVPYYNPYVVYGPWWWAGYPPVYWSPWPGYYYSGIRSGFYFGSGIAVSGGFFFSNFDWYHRHVYIVNVNNYYYSNYYHRHPEKQYYRQRDARRDGSEASVWRHDPDHRHGVSYRSAALQQQYGRSSSSAEARQQGNESVSSQGAVQLDVRPQANSFSRNWSERAGPDTSRNPQGSAAVNAGSRGEQANRGHRTERSDRGVTRSNPASDVTGESRPQLKHNSQIRSLSPANGVSAAPAPVLPNQNRQAIVRQERQPDRQFEVRGNAAPARNVQSAPGAQSLPQVRGGGSMHRESRGAGHGNDAARSFSRGGSMGGQGGDNRGGYGH